MTQLVALPRYLRWLLWAVPLLLFALPCVIGRNSTSLAMLAGLAAVLTPTILSARREASRNPVDVIFIGVFVALTVAFAITAEDARDLSYALNFVPFLLAVPLRWQLEREARADGAVLIGWLSLAGTIGAAGLAFVQIVFFGQTRVGQPWMNIFHYADTAMLLGFLTLAGWFAPGAHRRWPFLLGPVIGIASVIASGTRGTLLAAPVLLLLAFVFALVTAKRKKPILLAALAAMVLMAALLGIAVVLGLNRSFEAFTLSTSFLTGGKLDSPSLERLQMIIGGWRAFLASPLFGYGWGDMVPAIYPFVDPAYEPTMHGFRHLHNGFISFAAGAGLMGIVAFAAISVAPVVGVFASLRDSQYLCRLYLALTLSVSYAIFQLTFLLIGFDFPTVQYAYMTVAIIALVRDPRPVQSTVGNSAVGSETMKAV